MDEILAITEWPTNADMIVDVAKLGYLRKEWHTLDPTYGLGKWWDKWQPDSLVAHDLRLDGVDFRKLPHNDGEFDAIAFDPPYKLNGTATPEVDERYGVEIYATWRDRHQLIQDGITECLRVLKSKGLLLVKCQAQVSSGKIRWQPFEFSQHAIEQGAELVDALSMLGYRPQPDGTRQVHARQNCSTLLILQKQGRRKNGQR